jgi:hypothetical protein
MDDMTPIFAGAPVLIPQGNMKDIPGTYGWYQKLMNKKGTVYTSKGYKEGYNCYGNFGSGPSQNFTVHDYGK